MAASVAAVSELNDHPVASVPIIAKGTAAVQLADALPPVVQMVKTVVLASVFILSVAMLLIFLRRGSERLALIAPHPRLFVTRRVYIRHSALLI